MTKLKIHIFNIIVLVFLFLSFINNCFSENLLPEKLIENIKEKINFTKSFEVEVSYTGNYSNQAPSSYHFYFSPPNKYLIEGMEDNNRFFDKYIFDGIYKYFVRYYTGTDKIKSKSLIKYPIKKITKENALLMCSNILINYLYFSDSPLNDRSYKLNITGKDKDNLLVLHACQKKDPKWKNVYFYIDPKSYFILKILTVYKMNDGKIIKDTETINYIKYDQKINDDLFMIKPSLIDKFNADRIYNKMIKNTSK
jgi:outer membrane lipoprotein-sorting protein